MAASVENVMDESSKSKYSFMLACEQRTAQIVASSFRNQHIPPLEEDNYLQKCRLGGTILVFQGNAFLDT